MTAYDFLYGLFGGLARNGVRCVSLDGLDKKIVRIFSHLQNLAPIYGVNVRFRMRLRLFHEDSPSMRDELLVLLKNRAVVRNDSFLQLREAHMYHAEHNDLFDELAKRFIACPALVRSER